MPIPFGQQGLPNVFGAKPQSKNLEGDPYRRGSKAWWQYRTPEFFGPQFEELIARDRQRTQSMYGGMTAELRESLANAGLLASGALPDALTRMSIGLGQEQAGSMSNLYGAEYGRKGSFDTNRALLLMQQDFERQQKEYEQENDLLNTLLGFAPIAAKAGMMLL